MKKKKKILAGKYKHDDLEKKKIDKNCRIIQIERVMLV